MPAGGNFTSVPILDYSLVKIDKAKFLGQLRHALVYVGFLYVENPPVSPELISNLISYIPQLFDLPHDEKDRISKQNSEHFLGYSCFGSGRTKSAKDLRENFEFARQYKNTWKPGDPDFWRFWGDAQWPHEELLPGFKETLETYICQVEDFAFAFVSLFAEALGLPPDALDKFYDIPKKSMQHRCQVVKYPTLDETTRTGNQGMGPHYDAGFLTFLLQASPHEGLQVQNVRGDWIPATPIPGTFVVNIGKGLEAATRGVAVATSHRVISPPAGSGPRYSVPFFQSISPHIRMSQEILELPEEIQALARVRGAVVTDSVNLSEYGHEQSGHVTLIARCQSYPEIAQRHYPEIFKKYFPDGLPAQDSTH